MKAKIYTLIKEWGKPEGIVVFTNGSVKKRKVKMGDHSTTQIPTSSMCLEVKALCETFTWLQNTAALLTDTMSTLEKVKKSCLYTELKDTTGKSTLARIVYIFLPGHAGVRKQ